jgi:nicotinate (nicotinamide) nucleotide adenylyltransferase
MQNPWKPAPLFDFDTRCNIIRSDVRPINIIHQSHDVVKVCAVEHALKSPYYSANTLDVLYSKYCPENELYIICGADVINSISSWKDYDERIKNRYKYIVFKRAGMTINETIEKITVVDNDIPDISSTQIKNDLMSGKSAYPLITESTQWFMLSVKELSGR